MRSSDLTHLEERSQPPIVTVQSVDKIFRIYATPLQRLLFPIINRLRRVVGMTARSPRVFQALHDVSFKIAAGETVGIIGRNGSGKSTLLQILVGTLTPTAGSVSVRGRVSALLELGAGFNPEFTGRENVYLAGAIIGLGTSEMNCLISEIEQFADIGEFIDQPVKTYSSGMYVRLAFSVAIHVSPDILVVDEALAVGDTAFQTKCLTRIRKMQSEGVSIILVTHSTNTLLEYCDRGIYLRQGAIVMDGACREVVRRYADDLVDEEGGSVVYVDGASADTHLEQTPSNSPDGSTAALAQPQSEILQVDILDCTGLARSTFAYGEIINVRVRFRVNNLIRTPCYGLQIKSTDDIGLWSGTTQNMSQAVATTVPGEYTINWRLTLNLTGNRYVIAVGIGDVDSGEYHRHSRVPYAGHIDVLPEPHSGHGWIALNPQFTSLAKA